MSNLSALDVFFQIRNLSPFVSGRTDYTIEFDYDDEEMVVKRHKEDRGYDIYGTRKEIKKLIRQMEINDISYGEYIDFVENNNNKRGER